MNIRPTTIEFTGTPNSGKTTLINSLYNEFSKKGYSVSIIREDAELVPKEIPKKTWERNIWITFGQLRSLIEISFSTADLIFLDRGYYDSLFWARFLRIQSICSQEQSDFLYNFLTGMEKDFNFIPDWLFVFDVSVEESLRRRYSLGGNIVYSNDEFISLYKKELKNFYYGIDSSKWYLDTTNIDIQNVHEITSNKILKILENQKKA